MPVNAVYRRGKYLITAVKRKFYFIGNGIKIILRDKKAARKSSRFISKKS